jgi:hypothetical protein
VAVGDATGETKGRRSRSGDYREMGPGLKKDQSHVPFNPSRLGSSIREGSSKSLDYSLKITFWSTH